MTANAASGPFVDATASAWTDLGGGIRRQLLTFDDRMMMVRVAFEAGAVGTAHSHPHVQCSLVESGTFDVTIDGVTTRLSAGSSFLVPSGAVHGCRAVEAGALVDVFTPPRADFLEG
jgi:quercetin dioxygenase-like cupin family protein